MCVPERNMIPRTAIGPNQRPAVQAGRAVKGRLAAVRGVVVTLTLNVSGAVALTDSLAGTEQLAPFGAPVQLNDAVVLIPAPPIDRVYEAACPAETVAELDPPEGTTRPKPGLTPIPDSETVCGLGAALSETVKEPDLAPAIVGVKVTMTWQETDGPIEMPQSFVSAKSPDTEICVMFRVAPPGLVKVTVSAGLEVATS